MFIRLIEHEPMKRRRRRDGRTDTGRSNNRGKMYGKRRKVDQPRERGWMRAASNTHVWIDMSRWKRSQGGDMWTNTIRQPCRSDNSDDSVHGITRQRYVWNTRISPVAQRTFYVPCHIHVRLAIPIAVTELNFIMVALWNRADHYIFALWFLSIFLSFFFFISLA